jgi:hypothetical protein
MKATNDTPANGDGASRHLRSLLGRASKVVHVLANAAGGRHITGELRRAGRDVRYTCRHQ